MEIQHETVGNNSNIRFQMQEKSYEKKKENLRRANVVEIKNYWGDLVPSQGNQRIRSTNQSEFLAS